MVETIERADELHVDATVEGVGFERIVEDVIETVHGDAASIRRGLRSSDAHALCEGEGRFVDERPASTATRSSSSEGRRDASGSGERSTRL